MCNFFLHIIVLFFYIMFKIRILPYLTFFENNIWKWNYEFLRIFTFAISKIKVVLPKFKLIIVKISKSNTCYFYVTKTVHLKYFKRGVYFYFEYEVV